MKGMGSAHRAVKKEQILELKHFRSGVLPFAFNSLLCQALNMRAQHGATHFLLWHADTIPTENLWLDKMCDIMMRTGADALSVISPIKDQRGLTSTGRDLGSHRIKRFTMKEIHAMPETFTFHDIALNTGLLLIDIRKPWVAECPFDFDSEIRLEKEKGIYYATTLSEDWLWSRRAREKGAKLYATRSIAIEHVGSFSYSNQQQWGWDTDKIYENLPQES
jgi:GT2 family glycosyltransferase